MEITDDEIRIDKPPSELDALALDIVRTLDAVGIEYAVVSGYVTVLLGRSRATEDIDVIVERFDSRTADALASRLRNAGYWGPAMPLEDMYETLDDGLAVRIAKNGDLVPNVEVKFATDRYSKLSLANTVTVTLNESAMRIGSLELQIAYKLGMGAERDFEDALYLYNLLGPSLTTPQLEEFVEELDVESEYDRLRSK